MRLVVGHLDTRARSLAKRARMPGKQNRRIVEHENQEPMVADVGLVRSPRTQESHVADSALLPALSQRGVCLFQFLRISVQPGENLDRAATVGQAFWRSALPGQRSGEIQAG